MSQLDSAATRIRWKELLLAFSLANLCFLRTWKELLYGSFSPFFVKPPSTSANALAAVMDIVLLAAIIWLVRAACRRWPNRSGVPSQWSMLFPFLIALNAMATPPPPPTLRSTLC